ncbi:hypothetical protein TSACC_23009 [Terrimicrobium sacchariphilum]|uniref:Uncharacterized protein n=2 Tax=Terrimicrobium sacchariphilum TaxID=690879 RepID=A0A146GDI1_TERSA|nr:hypothetical protein TSACC_23009 [Terrimicrobium sacchariphilum]
MNPLSMMKRIPWRKILSSIGFLLLLLVTLIVLAGTWFSFQGRREWAETKAELQRRGEVLSYEGLVPAPVPPEQNFFADPIWEPDANGRVDLLALQIGPAEAAHLKAGFPSVADLVKEGDRVKVVQAVGRRAKDRTMTPEEAAFVLAVLEPVQGDLDTLERLAKRPEARFPVDYSKGLAMPLHHVTALLKLGQVLLRRAQAEAAVGRTEQSVDDILLILRLARTVDDEPVLISFLVALSLDSLALDVIEKQVPSWNAEQAQRVGRALGQSDILKQAARAFRGERAFGNQLVDQLKQASHGEVGKTLQMMVGVSDVENRPTGLALIFVDVYRFAFLDGDRAYFNKTHQRWLDSLEKEPGRVHPHDFENIGTELEREKQEMNRYRHVLTLVMMPALTSAFSRAASVETRVRQARIACAIQRYALSERALPSALDQLVPRYLEGIPTDVISGRPMHYRSDGKEYVLWSVGWNEKDDRGEGSPSERRPEKKLDWVWKGRLPEVWRAL